MEGSITFYTYGSSIELNGKLFTAGELTADLLNLSAERYRPMHQRFEQIEKLATEYMRTRERSLWWELNGHLEDLSRSLREYKLFRLILEEDDVLFSETRSYTERYSFLPEEDPDWSDHTPDRLAEISRQYADDDAEETFGFLHADTGPDYNYEIEFERRREQEDGPDDLRFRTVPDIFLIWAGNSEQKWRYYESVIDRYGMYLHDIRAFNTTIHNFIRYMLSGLETNSSENYAAALYEFYNDQRLAEKLIPNPFQLEPTVYTVHDNCALSYLPRETPDGRFVISQELVTDSVQGILKADYMLALNSGHNIRQCAVCKQYFLLRTGAHALYCEGACPAALRFTCRQFGTKEVQKELAKDIPKVRAKLTAFERITKDQQRSVITKEDARRAKDYVRDLLYEALRDKDFSLEEFERRVAPQALYDFCGITRTANPRGRPRKQRNGDIT